MAALRVNEAWPEIHRAARDALATGEPFASVKWGRRYRVVAVSEERIDVERLDARDPTTLSRRMVEAAVGRLNEAGGRARRATVISTVAKETALVRLHPRLRWSEDGDWVEVVASPSGEEAVPLTYTDFGQAPDDDPARLQQFARKVRAGQPAFRKRLLALYGGRCAITGWGPEAVLEAAHVLLHAQSGCNRDDNGILLRSDLHALFDDGLLKIHPQSLAVVLHPSLRDTPYGELAGNALRPRTDGSRPSAAYLRKRWDLVP